jgi:hypothetical protein
MGAPISLTVMFPDMHNATSHIVILKVCQPKGMVSTPKTIDFPKQRIGHGIYSDSFLFQRIWLRVSQAPTKLFFKKA